MQKVAVFIHGAGGGGWEWHLWTPVFDHAGWRCIALDLQPTDEGIADTRLEHYLGQANQWACVDGPAQTVLIGASMGGLIALKTAEALPVAALVLVNPVGPAGFQLKRASKCPPIIEWSQGTLEDSALAMPDSDEAVVELAYRNWRDESGAVLNEIHAGVEVSNPTVPVLILAGEDDEDVPSATGKALAEKIGADFQILEEMGHLSPLLGRAAPAVAAHVLHWLSKVVPIE